MFEKPFLFFIIFSFFIVILAEDKKSSDAYWREGDQFFSKGKYSDAVRSYSDALDLEPENINVLYKRAEASFFDKKFTSSIRDLSRIVNLDEKFLRV